MDKGSNWERSMVTRRPEHRRGYCPCGKKLHVEFHNRKFLARRVQTKGHDLCRRCWQREQDQMHSRRMHPKPWWAVKAPATLPTLL